MITEPDASGGLGSYTRDLWGALTGALNVVAVPALGKLLDVNATATVGPNGEVVYAAQPAAQPTVADKAKAALGSPLVIAGLVGVGLLLVVLAVRK